MKTKPGVYLTDTNPHMSKRAGVGEFWVLDQGFAVPNELRQDKDKTKLRGVSGNLLLQLCDVVECFCRNPSSGY